MSTGFTLDVRMYMQINYTMSDHQKSAVSADSIPHPTPRDILQQSATSDAEVDRAAFDDEAISREPSNNTPVHSESDVGITKKHPSIHEREISRNASNSTSESKIDGPPTPIEPVKWVPVSVLLERCCPFAGLF